MGEEVVTWAGSKQMEKPQPTQASEAAENMTRWVQGNTEAL